MIRRAVWVCLAALNLVLVGFPDSQAPARPQRPKRELGPQSHRRLYSPHPRRERDETRAAGRQDHADATGLLRPARLGPTPDQIKQFVENAAPDAYEKLIDQLLASPQYGERWGRYWLDVARYADSSGFEGDMYFGSAWRCRDYVINALNEDKPYDQFVQEQIAGDEIWLNDLALEGGYIVSKQRQLDFQRRIATGLYTVGPIDFQSALTEAKYRSERLSDMAAVTGSAFLGLTIACARCHDHKFDPIPQKDYYRLEAIFAGSEARDVPAVEKMSIAVKFQTRAVKLAAAAEIRTTNTKRLTQLANKGRKRAADKRGVDPKSLREPDLENEYTPEEKRERDKLFIEIGQAYAGAPQPYPTASVLAHSEIVPDVHVEQRGDFHKLGEKVGPGFPSALSDGIDLPDPPVRPFIPQRRKALALWLTGPKNPLTARVMVNRIWQGHFGLGIVATANDFGRQGDVPTHPELLDWLATEFVARGWSIKPCIG